ncbi:hypothetical protein FA15DRAFT_275124 [Coprinopsis marcescibilis]|uniref:Uncharacterized protein n=1 Tax=Coprinopsis marcescibilis TaxID=230819 RepID=A0A5C3KDL9_COPMA|nr:hypothetical protein FA15DRAFT_275124 [Coprinopsis marcescibilis]
MGQLTWTSSGMVEVTGCTAMVRSVEGVRPGADDTVWTVALKERKAHLRSYLGITVKEASQGKYVHCELCRIRISLERTKKSTKRGGFYKGNLVNHLVRAKHEAAVVKWVEDNDFVWQIPEKVREWVQRKFPATARSSFPLPSLKATTPSVQKRKRRVKARSSPTPLESRPAIKRKRRQRNSVSPLWCLYFLWNRTTDRFLGHRG